MSILYCVLSRSQHITEWVPTGLNAMSDSSDMIQTVNLTRRNVKKVHCLGLKILQDKVN